MSRPRGIKNKAHGIGRIDGYYSQLNILISPEIKASFKLYCAVNKVPQRQLIEGFICSLLKGGARPNE